MADNNNKQWFEKDDKGAPKKHRSKPVPPKGTGARPDGKKMPPRKASGNQPPKKNVQGKPAPAKAAPSRKPVPNKPTSNKPIPDKKIKNKVAPAPKSVESEVDEIIAPIVGDNKDKPVDSKKQKKYTKKKGIRTAVVALGVVALSVMVLVFVVHHLFDYFAVKPEMMFITNGSVEHTIGAKALIVRDEKVIASTVEGDLVTQATEGSRVSVGQRVAMVVPASMQTVVSNLRYTQSQISEVQQELIQQGDDSGAAAIYDNINASLVPIIDMIRLDAMDGNISDMSSYSSSITVLLSQREKELAGLQFDDERLRVLRNDEAGYNSQLERNASMVNAIYPGIISFKLDGLETELTFDTLLDGDVSTVRDYIDSADGIITSDLYVNANENLARIASNERQFMAVYLDSDDASADAFSVDSLHTINVGSEGISIGKCRVERCVVDKNGMLVVFSTTHYVEDLLDLRSVDIEIVITESTGLRVPVSSLVNADYDRNVATIYVNNQGFVDEVGVIIVDSDREFAIITPIGDSNNPNTSTVIITNPGSTEPGKKVDE